MSTQQIAIFGDKLLLRRETLEAARSRSERRDYGERLLLREVGALFVWLAPFRRVEGSVPSPYDAIISPMDGRLSYPDKGTIFS
ncbi:unnamed protein product [Pleuronectes platessa]|uniref:Uncharacterized protein n=1 Tax=Pleuronectes platessa TaxID=8262 RepID=A0A9N7Y6D1_PLEPL|nr:unnamed protein product [Pleuronectes platessa]